MKNLLSYSILATSLALTSMATFAESTMQRDTSKITQVQEIRNATIKITYADTTFLIDPMFAPKGFS